MERWACTTDVMPLRCMAAPQYSPRAVSLCDRRHCCCCCCAVLCLCLCILLSSASARAGAARRAAPHARDAANTLRHRRSTFVFVNPSSAAYLGSQPNTAPLRCTVKKLLTHSHSPNVGSQPTDAELFPSIHAHVKAFFRFCLSHVFIVNVFILFLLFHFR